ncbi:MAG: hypothetical protein A4E32_01566 [Methanomassiliicoccales archaeon PtaU1.Bin124]|nr:MAG: hypothetical protein A4E32_01566 [Methanomassiliicoccales archaeon PtaU1.Bin124]
MSWAAAERKVPGGKLIRLKVECKDGSVAQAMIEGDFFLYPEEGLASLERALVNVRPSDVQEVTARLERTVQAGRMELIGFAVKDVVELLEEIGCSRTDGV